MKDVRTVLNRALISIASATIMFENKVICNEIKENILFPNKLKEIWNTYIQYLEDQKMFYSMLNFYVYVKYIIQMKNFTLKWKFTSTDFNFFISFFLHKWSHGHETFQCKR